jgi:diguanylate cyclase (GGDEF)-like protein
LFRELLDADLARTERGGQTLAVAYLDLDGFKCVNDSYGHDTGDVVLCETARRLLSTVRGADVVARLGGDEFVIVYEPNEPSSDDLIRRVERVLSMPIVVNDNIIVCCPASIGVADTRVVGHDAATLLAMADAAMYEVKRAHHRLGCPGARETHAVGRT